MKSNKQFMILSAIGIIMVVDAHSWTSVSIFNSVFPYNSFFMAMFLFISGYFFNIEKNLQHPLIYLRRKTKKLFLPYLGWSAAYGIFVALLKLITHIKVGVKFSFYNYFILPFLNGEGFDINAPAYFVPILFYTIVVYLFSRKVLNKIWNEYVMQALFVACGIFVIYYSISVNHVFSKNSLAMALKVLFALQFFQFGVLYKSKLENLFNKINSAVVIIFCIIAVNIIRFCVGDITWTLNHLNFNSALVQNGNFILCVIPFIVAVISIAFWLKIAKLLENSLGNNKICNFISNHTFGIMMHHIAFMALLNWILLIVNKIIPIAGLDINRIQSSSWYRFNPAGGNFYLFYFVLGIVGACFLCYVVDKLFIKIKVRYHNKMPEKQKDV